MDDKEIVEDNEDNANDADDESYEFEEEDVENEVYSKHKDLETRSDLKPSLSKKLVKTKKVISYIPINFIFLKFISLFTLLFNFLTCFVENH